MRRRLDRFARRDSVCRRLAEEALDSCLSCLVLEAAFTETDAAGASDEVAGRCAAPAAAGASAAHLLEAIETLAQCEISRDCVCALVEAAEATRLLARLNSSSMQPPPPPAAPPNPPPNPPQSSVSPCRRRINFRLANRQNSSSSPRATSGKKRPNAAKADSGAVSRIRRGEKQPPAQLHVRQRQRTPTNAAPTQQSNNHHKPNNVERLKRAKQQLQPPRQPGMHAKHQYQQQIAQQSEDSCDTTLADVAAITFAESEYVTAAAVSKKLPSSAGTGCLPMTAKSSSLKAPTTKAKLPETLLLCGLRPSAAMALATLDSSDRRLKTVERRTGCRLELLERRCCTATTTAAAAATTPDVTQQASYAMQVVPLRPDSRPRGCANMLRSLLCSLDPSGQYFFCAVKASELPTVGRERSRTVSGQRCSKPSTTSVARSKSAAKAVRSRSTAKVELIEQTSCQPLQQEQLPAQCFPSTIVPSDVAACCQGLVDRCATDCVLGVASSLISVAKNSAAMPGFQRRLERDREAVLSAALLCIFRSLTATEDDARLINDAMDEVEHDEDAAATVVVDCFDVPNEDDLCESTCGSFGYVRMAIQRTLMVCADEHRLNRLMAAFAASLPALADQRSNEASTNVSSIMSSYSTETQRVRRRLARLTGACWERLCDEAMASASGGAAALLEGVAFETASEVADRELAAEKQRQLKQQFSISRSSTYRPPGLSTLTNSRHSSRNSPSIVGQHQTTRMSQPHPLPRRLVSMSPAAVQQAATNNKDQQRQGFRRWRTRRVTLGTREVTTHHRQGPSGGSTVYLAEALNSLANRLITKQVWNACMKAQLMQRLRLRTS